MSDDSIHHRPELMEEARKLPASQWRRSSFCGGAGACVEVARLEGGVVAVREGTARVDCLLFSEAEWAAFTAAVKAGEFD